MKGSLLVSFGIFLLVCVLAIHSEQRTKEERKRLREERRRLTAPDKGEGLTDDGRSPVDGFNSKSIPDKTLTDRKKPLSASGGREAGGNERKNRGQKNNRRERIYPGDKTDKEEKDFKDDDDDDKDKNVIVQPQQFETVEEMLTNGYMDVGKEAQCVDIPRNMSMCQSIGYTKMRLPNLLHHTSISEVIHESRSWNSLLRSSCHPDAELFLCSLFSPVCLDQTIYPCRSLCNIVKTGCEGLMIKHGFQWPDMLNCDRLPSDNDLCIVAQSVRNATNISTNNSSTSANTSSIRVSERISSSRNFSNSNRSSNSSSTRDSSVIGNVSTNVQNSSNIKGEGSETKIVDDESGADIVTCSECRQIEKFSDLQEKYCSADFVARISANEVLQHGTELILSSHKRVKFLKEPPAGVKWEDSKGKRRNGKKTSHNFYLSNAAQCQCLGLSHYHKGGFYIVMGRLQRSVAPGAATYRMIINYITEYQSPALKRALRDLARNDRCGSKTIGSPTTVSNDKSTTASTTDDKKALKVERRRKKLERRLKKIARKEKKLKGGKDSADELNNDDLNNLNKKQKVNNNRRKTDRKNNRKQDKSGRTLRDEIVHKDKHVKDQRRQRKIQREERQKRLNERDILTKEK